MENKDLLDDNLDWDAEINNWTEEADTDPTPVTMLQTFNTEQEAYVAVALLEGEGIVGRVVSSITGGMTPFAYGNVRLFVAASQAEEATKVLRKMTGQEAVEKVPETSSTHILMIVIGGLFVLGLITRLLQKAFNSL
jgi:Putative prokaryotic signal transducing protein